GMEGVRHAGIRINKLAKSRSGRFRVLGLNPCNCYPMGQHCPAWLGKMPLVRVLTVTFLLMVATMGLTAQRAADPLTRARQAYNDQQFDRAILFAKEAKNTPALADSASLVLSREM